MVPIFCHLLIISWTLSFNCCLVEPFFSIVVQLNLFFSTNVQTFKPYLSSIVQLLLYCCLFFSYSTHALLLAIITFFTIATTLLLILQSLEGSNLAARCPCDCYLTHAYILACCWAHVVHLTFTPMYLCGYVWRPAWKSWWKRSPTLATVVGV
jgi:hypothetical protein